MSSKKYKQHQTKAICYACGKPGVTHEHIWNQWTEKALPKLHEKRYEIVTGLVDERGNPIPSSTRIAQGEIRTKTSRRFCKSCNGGWMREIGEAAKPHAIKLIKGEQIDIGPDEQRSLGAWIALCAMVADLQGKSRHKFPRSDVDHFYGNHSPPPHWYVGLGYYAGPIIPYTGCDLTPTAFVSRTHPENRESKIVVHSVSTVIGKLFTVTQAISPAHTGGLQFWPADINRPHVTPILPQISPLIRFPPPFPYFIHGFLAPGGGLARDISQRFPTHIKEVIGKVTA
jgi:hypothetical protein